MEQADCDRPRTHDRLIIDVQAALIECVKRASRVHRRKRRLDADSDAERFGDFHLALGHVLYSIGLAVFV